jgi:hypothetical protein
LLAKASALMSTEAGRAKVRRFTLHQRFQHWFLVISFTTLCLTGFPMKFADRAWAAWLINALGGLTTVRYIHRYTGAALVIGFVYHAVYVFNYMRLRRKTTRESWLKVFFNLPLCMNPKDLRSWRRFWLTSWGCARPDLPVTDSPPKKNSSTSASSGEPCSWA